MICVTISGRMVSQGMLAKTMKLCFGCHRMYQDCAAGVSFDVAAKPLEDVVKVSLR